MFLANFNFKMGQKYFYISDHKGGFENRISHGILIRTTDKFCVLDITKTKKRKQPNNPLTKRKTKKHVFATDKECRAVLMRRIESKIIAEFGVNIIELSEEYQELMAEYPERFI